MSAQTLLAYCYVTTHVIYVFKHLVLHFKDLWFIHEIPVPSTSVVEERSDKEHISLWIGFNIQVCIFVELCRNTIFTFSKHLLTCNISLIRNYWNTVEIKNSGTHPNVVIVLSILNFDDLNLAIHILFSL